MVNIETVISLAGILIAAADLGIWLGYHIGRRGKWPPLLKRKRPLPKL